MSDCCHSGSMLDHPEQQISGNKDPNAPPGAAGMDPMDMLGMFFRDIPVCNLSPAAVLINHTSARGSSSVQGCLFAVENVSAFARAPKAYNQEQTFRLLRVQISHQLHV